MPYGPLSHPYVERLIGTVGRDFLDQVPVWSTRDLEGELLLFNEFYNLDRVQRGPGGSIPDSRAANTDQNIARLHNYRWKSYCRGLYQLPAAS